MKSLKKHIATAGMAAVFAVSLAAGVAFIETNKSNVSADTGSAVTTGYYYDTLKVNGKEFTLAKKFYNALDEINESGAFKKGQVDYSLTEHNIVTSDEIKAWVIDGDVNIPRAFSAARDCYLSDHPEIFYIDFYKLTISAGRTNGVYSAYIDSGREANIYLDNGFTSEAQVNTAITAFNTAVNALVAGANAAVQAEQYGAAADVVAARYVNKALAESVEYDYGALDNYLSGSTAAEGAFTQNAYGGLVLNKSVCAGYSCAYKVVMDKLGIPCVIVKGYSQAKDGQGNASDSSVPHAWNYIWLADPVSSSAANSTKKVSYSSNAYAANASGKWYAVDVTWNSSAKDKNKYTIMSESTVSKDHVTDGVISSSGYELKYPQLSATSYGSTQSSESLACWIEYEKEGNEKDDYGNPLVSNFRYVSYNGKSVKSLLQDGLRIAFRTGAYDNGELVWTGWCDAANYYDWWATVGDANGISDNGVETKFYDNTSGLYTQFAVVDGIEPTLKSDPSVAGSLDTGYVLFYSLDLNIEDYMLVSKTITNESYGTYTPPPYVKTANPLLTQELTINDGMRDPDDPKGCMADKNAFTCSITYDEDLHVLDESKPIGITFVCDMPNIAGYADFVKFEDGNLVKLEGKRTLVFKFKPSLMYEHNRADYTFMFSNVGSSKIVTKVNSETGKTEKVYSNKIPNTVSYSFSRAYMACPKIFGDGRLWVDCCAQPTLLDNSDLSEVNFEDPDGGTYFSQAQRSQMLLVVDTVDTETNNTMLEELDGSNDIDIKKEDILKSETYGLNLQICGKYPTIPDGSYVKIALGFPEGYGPEDEGVTFKIYHRKHISGNTYEVEEIPCVVTQYGIVATVTSFSPYMVAVVPASKATDKTVYASVEGKGGKLGNADGQVKTVAAGGTCEYTVTPDAGYQVYSITLNGEEVKDSLVGNKLTLDYDALGTNNEITIKFISTASATRYENKANFEYAEPVRIIVPAGALYPASAAESNNVGMIVGIVIVVATLVICAGVITFVVIKKKKSTKN